MRSWTDSELAPERQEETAPPIHESETDNGLAWGAQLFWLALTARTVAPNAQTLAFAQRTLLSLAADKNPSFLRLILELVADQFCDGQKHHGRHIDNSRARLAALRDACRSFPTLDWTANIFPVQGHA
jgi:hypothetical protein